MLRKNQTMLDELKKCGEIETAYISGKENKILP